MNRRNLSTSHLTHDLNNIITRILNSLELLKKKVANYDEVEPIINSIESSAFMATEIMEDMQADSKGKPHHKKKIDVNKLIEILVSTVSLSQRNKVKFNLKLQPDLYPLEGRYSDFYRIFLNLIVNAIEAINNRGTITITTSNINITDRSGSSDLFNTQPYIQIKISDNGTGIDPEIIPFIFDENFSTKSKVKNRGFGLSIVKQIVDSYEGVIKVWSEKGKGSEFLLTFPSLGHPKEKTTEKAKQILLVEDEEILLELLTELLESYGYKITAVSDGKGMFKKYDPANPPDLLIIDQKLPDIEGIECIKKLRTMNKTIPIILASGSQTDYSLEPGINEIVSKIIHKPYNFDEILSMVKELIG
ncbi:response regulator [Melioribacter sp. OK-6-Me]|uniref:response regulator n=1 Tax=unclassified Melioribacter TaxID=2627329 RepID=UPI003EDAE858